MTPQETIRDMTISFCELSGTTRHAFAKQLDIQPYYIYWLTSPRQKKVPITALVKIATYLGIETKVESYLAENGFACKRLHILGMQNNEGRDE